MNKVLELGSVVITVGGRVLRGELPEGPLELKGEGGHECQR